MPTAAVVQTPDASIFSGAMVRRIELKAETQPDFAPTPESDSEKQEKMGMHNHLEGALQATRSVPQAQKISGSKDNRSRPAP
jgi:hypothetical protein